MTVLVQWPDKKCVSVRVLSIPVFHLHVNKFSSLNPFLILSENIRLVPGTLFRAKQDCAT